MTDVRTLRHAAAMMRALAEAAVTGDELRGDRWFAEQAIGSTSYEVAVSDEGTMIAQQLRKADAEHIASWHPAAALAVADWLDAAYDDELRFAAQGAHGFPGENPAFAVARAFLGQDA